MARHLLDCARCLSLTDPLAEKTVEIRRSATISLPDAVIAASALSLDAVLITRNGKDFSQVADLQVYDPFNP